MGACRLALLLIALQSATISIESFLTNNNKKPFLKTVTSRQENLSDDDLLETPEPRWECPTHEDVCAETGVTLSRYMMEMVRVNPDLEEIESSEWIQSMDVMAQELYFVPHKSMYLIRSIHIPASCMQDTEQLGANVVLDWPHRA